MEPTEGKAHSGSSQSVVNMTPVLKTIVSLALCVCRCKVIGYLGIGRSSAFIGAFIDAAVMTSHHH